MRGFLCSLINGRCSFMKNTHSITSGIKKLRQFALYGCAGDGAGPLISPNEIQQDRLSLRDQIGLFFILLSRRHRGSATAPVFLQIQNSVEPTRLLRSSRFLLTAGTFPSPLWDPGGVGIIVCVLPPSIFGRSYCFAFEQCVSTERHPERCTNWHTGKHLSLQLMFREATQSISMGWCFE